MWKQKNERKDKIYQSWDVIQLNSKIGKNEDPGSLEEVDFGDGE